MAYATVDDIISIFGQREALELSNLADHSATAVNRERWEAAIAVADRYIDSYLARRYTLPLHSPPYILKNCSAEIARYKLDRECKFRESVRVDYEDQKEWLKGIAAGKLDLGLHLSLEDGLEAELAADEQQVFAYTSDEFSGFADEVLNFF